MRELWGVEGAGLEVVAVADEAIVHRRVQGRLGEGAERD